MTSMFLSCYNLPVIKQVADVLGWIMNLLYEFFGNFGIYNIGLCIILFTVIVKMILLPMTIKQQKTMKLNSVMNPEIQAIQKKYRDRRDQESMMKMNQELSAVYEKYGTSPTGGCLPILIQMPILLALYGVVSQLPLFINDVGDYFKDVGTQVFESVDYFYDLDKLDELNDGDDEDERDEESGLNKILSYCEKEDGEFDKEKSIENIAGQFSQISVAPDAVFTVIEDAYDETDDIIEKFSAMSDEDWDKLLKDNEDDEKLIKEYSQKTDAQWSEIKALIDASEAEVEAIKEDVSVPYDFVGIDLGKSPSVAGGIWSILIPLLAAATQLLSAKISNKFSGTNQNTADNPMGSSMKMMTYTMPIMSAILCYTLPSGLGVYWIFNAVVQAIQAIFIGRHFMNVEPEDIMKANMEKINKKRAKQGLPPKKITTAAATNVKNIKVEETKTTDSTTNNNTASTNSGKSGIAAKANLVNKYNKK